MDTPSRRDAIRRNLAGSLGKAISFAIDAASDDQTRLDLIDEYLKRTWAIRDDLFYAINLEILVAKSHRNLHASIHKLSVELLVYIFRLSLPAPETGPRYTRNLRTLLSVCKSRASIIRGAHSLWTVVTSRYGLDFLVGALARLCSSTCPLHIHCQSMTEADFGFILPQISPHIRRWETAAIVMPQTEEGRHYLSAPAPRLRHLDLSVPLGTGTGDAPNYQPFEIFNGSADRLEEVKVTMTCLPWDSPILRGLKSLHLRWCRPILVSNVITILNDSPDLKTLILEDTEIAVDMQTDPSNAVTMTRLENLAFAVGELQGITEIIKWFKAPNCQTFDFHLQTEEPNDTEGFLLTTLAPYFPFFRRMMFEHPRTMINKSHQDDFYIRCSFGTELIEVTVWLGLYLPHTPTNVLVAFLRQVLGEGESSKPDVRYIIGRDWGTEGISILDEIPLYCNVVDLWLGPWYTLQNFGAEGILRSLRGVNVDYNLIWRLEALPKIEHVSWNANKIMDMEDQ